MSAKKNPEYPLELSEEPWLSWPDQPQTFAFELLRKLADREATRLWVTSCVTVFASRPRAIECTGVIKTESGQTLALVDVNGENFEMAHKNAAFFSARHALFGERAVCGTLLRTPNVHAELYPTAHENEYWLKVAISSPYASRRHLTGRALLAPSTASYWLRTVLDPRQDSARTRYLRVTGMHKCPGLKHFLGNRLRYGGPLRLHRLILALAGTDMSDGKIHGHHLNGIGFDCRIVNLVGIREHSEHHRRWASDLRNPEWNHVVFDPERDPFEVSMVANPVYPSTYRRRLGRHDSSEAIPKSLQGQFFIPAKRRDRRRNLERLVIRLLGAGGELSMNDLTHALSCSKSGTRKNVAAAAKLGILQAVRRGRAQYVRLCLHVPRKFRIKRLIGRNAHLRRFRLQRKLAEACPWFTGARSLAQLAACLRTVLLPGDRPVGRSDFST